MNILQIEDLVKGLPDQRLLQEAQQPSGQIPQYLAVSEIQRRTDMRKRFSAQQEQPEGTVADQIVQDGMASLDGGVPRGTGGMPQGMPPQQMPQQMSPQMPQQMYGGGIVQLAGGGSTYGAKTLWVNDGTGRMVKINIDGFATPQAAVEALWTGQNEPLEYGAQGSGVDQTLQFDPQGQLITSMGGGDRPAMSDLFTGIPGATQGPTGGGLNGGVDWEGWGLSLADANRNLSRKFIPPEFVDKPLDISRGMSNLQSMGDTLGYLFNPSEVKEKAVMTGRAAKELARGIGSEFGFNVGEGPFVRMLEEPKSDLERIAWMDEIARKDLIEKGAVAEKGGLPSLTGDSATRDPLKNAPDLYNELGEIASATQAFDREALLGKKQPGGVNVAGDGAEVQSVGLKRLWEIASRKSPPVPDFADIIAEQRKDAWSNALVQLGAGIANDDLAGGLERAGIVAAKGREEARGLEAQHRLMGYQGQVNDLTREADVVGKAAMIEATLEAERVRTEQYIARQEGMLARELARQDAADRRALDSQAATLISTILRKYDPNMMSPQDYALALRNARVQAYSALLGVDATAAMGGVVSGQNRLIYDPKTGAIVTPKPTQ